MGTGEKYLWVQCSTNEDDNAFVGIRISNEQIVFHYPESYNLLGFDKVNNKITDMKVFRKDVIDILNTIRLAKSHSIKLSENRNEISSIKSFAFLSYLWIIRDYLENGFYRNREKIYRTNAKGKVNWKKTFATQPIISNGNVIYSNLVVEVVNDCDSTITAAHRYCVFDSIRKSGWLFGLHEKAFYVPKLTNSLLKKYINAIKVELKRTFDDMKQARLQHMLKVLLGVEESKDNSTIVYGVDKYHYIYERMIDAVFGNVIDISKFNPNAHWYLKKPNCDRLEKIEASSLRPDTIRLEDNEQVAYVLDAKYYRYGTTGKVDDLPATTSIEKQITYAEHIKTNFNSKIAKIHNVFVLPYSKYHNKFGLNGNLEYIGYSKANWKDSTLDNGCDNIVHAFLIDTKHLISTWSQGNCQEDIYKLIRDIDEMLERI